MSRGKNILIVDDDTRNIFALSAVLNSMGYQVLSVENGQACLDLLRKQADAVNLILMDIMMPVMDGYETIKKIRASIDIVKLPIIAITANAMVGDDIKCFDAGANEYCSKPIDIDNLVELINKYISD